jgi:hypothetical protein
MIMLQVSRREGFKANRQRGADRQSEYEEKEEGRTISEASSPQNPRKASTSAVKQMR